MNPIRNRFAHLNVSQTFTLRNHSLFPEVVPFIACVASRLSVLTRATICELTAMWFCISPSHRSVVVFRDGLLRQRIYLGRCQQCHSSLH